MSTEEREPSADEIIAGFGRELAELRERHGAPSFENMNTAVRHLKGTAGSRNTFHRMVNQPTRIYKPDYVRGFVLALGLSEAEADEWEARRQAAYQALQRSLKKSDDGRIDLGPAEPPAALRDRRLIALVAGVAAVGILVGVLIGRVTAPHSRPSVVLLPPPRTGPEGAAPPPLASRPPIGQIRGPINIQAACQAQVGAGLTARPLNTRNAYTWKCVRPGETVSSASQGVNLDVQCLTQYGPGTAAKAREADDPQSWRCIQVA